jgi:hypothetical protein
MALGAADAVAEDGGRGQDAAGPRERLLSAPALSLGRPTRGVTSACTLFSALSAVRYERLHNLAAFRQLYKTRRECPFMRV